MRILKIKPENNAYTWITWEEGVPIPNDYAMMGDEVTLPSTFPVGKAIIEDIDGIPTVTQFDEAEQPEIIAPLTDMDTVFELISDIMMSVSEIELGV